MKFKDYFKSVMRDFFVIVTLINIATFILGSVFRPNEQFGYEAFLSPIIYGVFSLIPQLIFYSPKELTIKQLLIRDVLQLISIECILVFIGFGFSGIHKENFELILSFCLSIFVIYILVNVISWILDIQTAKKMTEELRVYQNTQSEGQ